MRDIDHVRRGCEESRKPLLLAQDVAVKRLGESQVVARELVLPVGKAFRRCFGPDLPQRRELVLQRTALALRDEDALHRGRKRRPHPQMVAYRFRVYEINVVHINKTFQICICDLYFPSFLS